MANITKVWIPPQVALGDEFHIIHAEGSLSIHPEAVIGNRVGVMHNVTIGTNMGPGAPVIGDDVFIGVNSTVLGPIRVGDRVRIAANTAVTTDVPDDSIVVGSPAKIYPAADAVRPPRDGGHHPHVAGRNRTRGALMNALTTTFYQLLARQPRVCVRTSRRWSTGAGRHLRASCRRRSTVSRASCRRTASARATG